MQSTINRTVLPIAVLVTALIVKIYLLPAILAETDFSADSPGIPLAGTSLSILAWLAGALLVIRLMEDLVWTGLVTRRTGGAPVRLLVNIIDLAIWLITIGMISHFVLGHPAGYIATSSGVVVALIAFALNRPIGDTFSGIALTLERPFTVGDWIDAGNETIGMVKSVSWRATTLEQQNGIVHVIPNGRMAETPLRVFHVWYDNIDLELAYAIPDGEVERLWLAALADVPGLQNLKPPVIRRININSNGVVWRLFYSLTDYPSKLHLRDLVIASLNRRMIDAGIAIVVPSQRIELMNPDDIKALPYG